MSKNNIKDTFSDKAKKLSNTTKELMNKTKKGIISTIDQNNNSSLDKEDVKLIKDKINAKVQKTTSNIKASMDKKKYENDLKKLKPIFKDSLADSSFSMQKLICISEPDKNFLDSEACKGAIGRTINYKDIKIVTIFKDYIDCFNVELYPNNDSTVYYMDPTNKNRYIAMEEYFDYLKQVRVNELEKIAQDLGAKHFKVTLMEAKKQFTKSNKKMSTKGQYVYKGAELEVETEHSMEDAKASAIEISAESNFKGHEPIEPKLHYLKNETDIENLIKLRMSDNTIENRKVKIKLSRTSGMKRKDAESIDGALKLMKIEGNTTIENEYSDEERRYFSYEIDF